MDSRIGHTHPWAMAEEQDSDINLRVDDGSGRMVLANEVNIGYEDMSYEQVLKLNGTRIKHSPFGSSTSKGQFLVFEFEGNNLVVVEREEALSASASILKDYGIPKIIRSSGPYIDSIEQSEAANHGDSPVSNQKGKKRSAEINVLMAIGCW
ncbi:hypothetical protein T459_18592 [Capsicum annuum]|uniref:Protease Do-like PDZ domain-containing protein n=1 Tax=Capsicum annuum TaxID=4072 RepID=A0A2G2ZEW8_CAPAN|nr:hypothetical protein T459_18592 [Capsicum annuum]